jgi:hypothetical protein
MVIVNGPPVFVKISLTSVPLKSKYSVSLKDPWSCSSSWNPQLSVSENDTSTCTNVVVVEAAALAEATPSPERTEASTSGRTSRLISPPPPQQPRLPQTNAKREVGTSGLQASRPPVCVRNLPTCLMLGLGQPEQG